MTERNVLLTCSHGTKIAYILSLGVLKEYRSNGVASFMLGNLLSHLRSGDHRDVRAVYLHVLTTNNAAITFYEHRGFKVATPSRKRPPNYL